MSCGVPNTVLAQYNARDIQVVTPAPLAPLALPWAAAHLQLRGGAPHDDRDVSKLEALSEAHGRSGNAGNDEDCGARLLVLWLCVCVGRVRKCEC